MDPMARWGETSHASRRRHGAAVVLMVAALTLVGCWGGRLPDPTSGTEPGIAGLIDVPGTHVSLVPPDGFSASRSFPGFEATDEGAQIVVAEHPGTPIGVAVSGMTRNGLASRAGMTMVGSEELTLGRWRAMIVDAKQLALGKATSTWILILGDDGQTASIVATYPADAAHLRDPLRAALESVVLDPDRPTDPLEALPFTLEPAFPLRFAGVVSNMGGYNTSGSLPAEDPSEPTLLVGQSLGSPAVPSESFLPGQLRRLEWGDGLRLGDVSAITVDGLAGYEVTGTTNDPSTGRALGIYGAVLFQDESHYLLAVGVCLESMAHHMFPVFQASVETLRLRS